MKTRAPEPPLDRGLLPDLIGYQLRRAQLAVFRHLTERLQRLGLTPGQFGTLEIIRRNPAITQIRLSRAAGIDRSSIVGLIDRFEARGWVERSRSRADRRAHALWLTEAGEALLREAEQVVRAHEREVARELSEEDKARLIALLPRILPGPEDF